MSLSSLMVMPKLNVEEINGNDDDHHARMLDGFQDRGSRGLSCRVCGCLVARYPGDAERHRRWHRAPEVTK